MRAFRILSTVVALGLGIAILSAQAQARLSDGEADVCWAPDSEFPVPCDEDEA